MWELPATARPDMRVPARVVADEEILAAIEGDMSLDQLANVATLPGIVEAAIGMPDIHQGYGFPVGGVAATRLPDGVVSPGGVGYDINCGVRLLALPLTETELGSTREALVHEIALDPGGRRQARRARARRGRSRCRPPGRTARIAVDTPRRRRAHGVRGTSGRCGSSGGERAGSATRPPPAGNDGLGQPFRGAADGRRGPRR